MNMETQSLMKAVERYLRNNMKQIITLFLALVFAVPVFAANPNVTPGLKISEYPNTSYFTNLDMVIFARTNVVPRTNLNMQMGDLARQITNGLANTGYVATAVLNSFIAASNYASFAGSNYVSVLPGSNATVVLTSTNGTNFYTVSSTASGTSTTPGVDQAPGTTVIVVDGGSSGILNRTSTLTSATSVIFSNLTVGLPIKWWGFSSGGAWDVGVPQSHSSNTVSTGIEQPFTNTWIMVEALATSAGWTNFDSEAQGYTIGPGTNVVFDTNTATRHISVSAAGASGGFGAFETLTNGVRLALSTNNNWVSYVTGMLSGTTATLGVDGAAILASIAFRTNQFTTNVAGSPVLGAIWFNGTNGITPPMTNGARVGVEWTPVQRALRVGELGNNGAGPDPFDVSIMASNYWHATNIGFGSIAMGSNVMAKAPYSLIANGIFNIIHSNAVASSITGGSNNIIYTNAVFANIGGGALNTIRMDSIYATVGGGNANDVIGSTHGTIAGGDRNDINSGSIAATIGGGSINTIGNGTVAATYSSILGGRNNQADSADCTVGGGQLNIINSAVNTGSTIAGGANNNINQGSIYATVGGGNNNDIGVTAIGDSDYSVISGGLNNILGGATDMGVIVGGELNVVNTSGGPFPQILGGTSNNIGSVAMATVIGNFITNNTGSGIEIGHLNFRKQRTDINGLKVFAWTNTTASVGGTMVVSNVPIASAGAAETNLLAYAVPAHVMTNSNDRLKFRASGRFAATSNAKQVKVVLGSQTLFDSGSQVANTGAWVVEGEIIRTGNTAQSCNATFHGGTNTAFITESALDLVQTNGIVTTLKITGTAAGDGDITNRTMIVEWFPAP